MEEHRQRRYRSGTMRADEQLRDGVRHGICRYYYRSGALKQEATFVDGRQEGVTRDYDADGHLAAETTFVNGKRNGPVRLLRADGSVQARYSCCDDLVEGEYCEYGPDGQLIRSVAYVKGVARD